MYLKINSLEPSSVAAVAPDRQANEQQSLRGLQEVVADKGSQQRRADGLHGVGDSFLISEPDRRRRKWCGKRRQQQAVYGIRRRMRDSRGR